MNIWAKRFAWSALNSFEQIFSKRNRITGRGGAKPRLVRCPFSAFFTNRCFLFIKRWHRAVIRGTIAIGKKGRMVVVAGKPLEQEIYREGSRRRLK